MKKRQKWKQLRKIMLSIVVSALIFAIIGCGKKEELPTEITTHFKADSQQQRETLFSHIGLNISDYEITDSIEDSETVSQWWYKNINDESNGIYVAIGDIQANKGKGFVEFDTDAPAIRSSDDYLLEISIGSLTEDGHLDVENSMRTYYFIQTGNDIAFMSLVQ